MRRLVEQGMLLRTVDYLLAKTFAAIGHVCYREELKFIVRFAAESLGHVRSMGSHLEFRQAVDALVVGEDRRFFAHFGVDTKGLARALAVYLARREVQGASTITQQLVRVVTCDYRRSVRRKLKELSLASAASDRIEKVDQAELYLTLAYYGWRMNGLQQALVRLQCSLPLTQTQASELIARLRYPEPANASPLLLVKIRRRAAYINSRMKGAGRDGDFN